MFGYDSVAGHQMQERKTGDINCLFQSLPGLKWLTLHTSPGGTEVSALLKSSPSIRPIMKDSSSFSLMAGNSLAGHFFCSASKKYKYIPHAVCKLMDSLYPKAFRMLGGALSHSLQIRRTNRTTSHWIMKTVNNSRNLETRQNLLANKNS